MSNRKCLFVLEVLSWSFVVSGILACVVGFEECGASRIAPRRVSTLVRCQGIESARVRAVGKMGSHGDYASAENVPGSVGEAKPHGGTRSKGDYPAARATERGCGGAGIALAISTEEPYRAVGLAGL